MDGLVKEPNIKSIFWRVSLNPKPLSQEVLSWRLIGNVVPAFYSAMWLLHLSKDLASSFLPAREMTAERLYLVVEPSKMRFLSYMYIYTDSTIPKRRIESYSILGTIASPHKILLSQG